MAHEELEDYIKTQKSLGVRDHDIRNSLLKAGYTEEEFDHHFRKHAEHTGSRISTTRTFSMTARHILYMNIAAIIIFASLFAFITYDYNIKFRDLAIQQDQGFNRTEHQLIAQTESLRSLQAQDQDIKESIDATQGSIDTMQGDLEAKIEDYNYRSLTRDSALSNSIQKSSKQSLTELSIFSEELESFRKASVDFSGIIPKAIRSVVTIGMKGPGFFTTAGSGVLINDQGYIVTNWHVIDDIKQISVKTSDDKDYTARLIGRDELWDIALIKLETEETGFDYLEFADSDKVSVGDHVIAIGNPVGFDSTVTEGIISNTNRLISGNGNIQYLQTDVAINAGNSGGPLIDKDGKIVGIASLKYMRTGFEGLSFAIRSNDVQGKVLGFMEEGST
jgi:S1-C subfamily serine protease